nr:MFS transporter [Salsipaludibacter albus]
MAALPVFLVGGLAVQIRRDLGFADATLGAVVSAAFLVGAVAGPVAGRLTDRLGARSAILLGAGWSLASCAGIALLVDGWATLGLFLALSGLGFAFMDPGLAILVARTVPPARQGLAFGVKEAAVPGAALVAGLAIPSIAVTVGWRWAFALAIVPAMALAALLAGTARRDERTRRPVARDVARDPSTPSTPPPRALLVSIALAAALGSGAASGVGVFLTESATANGFGESAAGLLLATGSIAGIVARIAAGMRADRRPGSQLGLMTVMLATGAVAMLVGSLGSAPALVIGTIGTFAAGWGWSGLLFLTLLRLSPGAPGAATGIGLAGLSIGNAVGPLGFGLIAQSTSYRSAWLTAAVLAAAAAGVLAVTTRRHGLRGPDAT